MTHILILIVVHMNGVGVTTAEFDSRLACESARIATVELWEGHWKSGKSVCVPKDQ